MTGRNELSTAELWRRVRGLEGRTVYTLNRQNPNVIERVKENHIIIQDRKSQPTRESLEEVYDRVSADGVFRVREGRQAIHVYAVVPAIVLAALPEQVRATVGSGPVGIELIRGS